MVGSKTNLCRSDHGCRPTRRNIMNGHRPSARRNPTILQTFNRHCPQPLSPSPHNHADTSLSAIRLHRSSPEVAASPGLHRSIVSILTAISPATISTSARWMVHDVNVVQLYNDTLDNLLMQLKPTRLFKLLNASKWSC